MGKPQRMHCLSLLPCFPHFGVMDPAYRAWGKGAVFVGEQLGGMTGIMGMSLSGLQVSVWSLASMECSDLNPGSASWLLPTSCPDSPPPLCPSNMAARGDTDMVLQPR
jgi:hypothetical protein